MLTFKQIKEQFNISRNTVKAWIKAGLIQEIKTPGGHYRVLESDVRKVLGL